MFIVFALFYFFNINYMNVYKSMNFCKFLEKKKTAELALFKLCSSRDAERTGGRTDHIIDVITFESFKKN